MEIEEGVNARAIQLAPLGYKRGPGEKRILSLAAEQQ